MRFSFACHFDVVACRMGNIHGVALESYRPYSSTRPNVHMRAFLGSTCQDVVQEESIADGLNGSPNDCVCNYSFGKAFDAKLALR